MWLVVRTQGLECYSKSGNVVRIREGSGTNSDSRTCLRELMEKLQE